MDKLFSNFIKGVAVFGALSLPLCAERNAWYVGASYQVGQVGQMIKNPPLGDPLNYPKFPSGHYTYAAVMQGLGISVGYKHFLGHKKWFGLRYYGFMDYGHAVFGANELVPGQGTVANLTDMFTYGGGIDTLYDVINRDTATFGFFFGVAIAGNSWGNTTGGFLKSKGDIDPAIFQFLFNAGLRTTIAKHQEFDFGVKIPTINDYYFHNGPLTFTYRRQYSLYVGYRFNF
ncbi:outer membrane protein [Helicobacter salomonis]|uniref:OMP1005 n=1 Tax=Helicobacter salomonis TaxID=56878 RepID=A0A1M4NJ71_9HELI|nr:outer membrane protein [Helicobacter salomonis]SFZ72915.1 OMP997 [Helicobacter salomonis]SFZ73016.1 OMP1005 [Helicobacter salomonis]SFZ73089.1 OMP375 [Helicobacter salomonis]